ncbi:multi-sensor hybrid histidine kinase [Rhizoctonia solani]|uniref:Multi-sensor hybrid histidine kinase n=1 Tax=Rhizoctonia solani TaxID=456999 RepID=A0A0K6GDC3_9AGAM|nr:multi-sensor hybrid histidine kinase [Rhizoctonia solani]
MLDLHEAMRGLRFAPEALAVLDANRQVRVISRQAERLFGVPAAEIVGRTTNHLWAEEARPAFRLALNEAAQRIGHADTAAPVIRRLKTTKTVLDMCVSAWHPTDDPMYATSKTPTNSLSAPRTIMIHECFYTISLRDVGAPRRHSRKMEAKSHLEPPTLQPVDEGVDLSPVLSPLSNGSGTPRCDTPNVIPEDYHASLRPQGHSNGFSTFPRRSSPCPSISRSSPSPPPITLAETLRDGVIDALDTAVIALSVDGTIAVRNQQWVDLAGGEEPGVVVLSGPSPSRLHSSPDANATREWHPSLVLTDLGFTRPIGSSAHPLYRAAILGQVVNELRCGGVRIDEDDEMQTNSSSPTQTERSDSLSDTLRGFSPTRSLKSLPGDGYFSGNASPVDDAQHADDRHSTVPRGARLVLDISARPVRDSRGELVGGVMTIRDVTQLEKDRVESVQNESNMQFEQICDCLPQLVWTTRPDGYHTYYNKGWYEYTGADPHVSAGLGWQGLFHPDDMPAAAVAWSHSLRTGEMYETNYRCRRRDGVYRWMVGRALPVRDRQGRITRWLGTCTDIHDTVEALAVSRRAQERLQATLNHAAVTLWAVDQDFKVTVAEGPGLRQLKLLSSPQGSTSSSRSDHSSQPPSSRSAAAHRLRNHSMIGRSIYEAWDVSLIGSALERAFAGEMAVQEMEIEGRWFRTQFTPLREEWEGASGEGVGPEAVAAGAAAADDERPVVGVVGASMDITDRKIAETRLRESFTERSRLLASETAAKEASRLKSQFLANMSHEIRTPIAGVIGLSELLCDTHLNEEQRAIAENIQRSADALLTVINDILDFSKVEMGKLDIDNIPLSLGVVLLDTKKMLTFATKKKGLIFKDEILIQYAGRVMGDPGRLRQVLTNLLSNSIKFTSEGSITLRAIEECQDEKTVRVRFSIEDEGVGIADSIRKRLFRPFSQADSSTARRYGGTGLGLTISKNLVELMGGQIGLDSKEGKGTCAWFSVPFVKACDEVCAAPRSLSPEAAASITVPPLPKIDTTLEPNASNGLLVKGMAPRPSGSLQRPRQGIWILVAEDNLINQQIALKSLRKMNFNAEAADNGKQVLAALERRTYDLILMDCQMPEMDGYEATKCIRQLESVEMRSVPIIAMTASAIRGDKEKCLEVGMSDYLSKPVKRQALEAMLVRWLYDETYRQKLSRWFLPPSQNSSVSSAGTPPLENGTPTSARPPLFQASESTQSTSGFSVASDATIKIDTAMTCCAAVKVGSTAGGVL